MNIIITNINPFSIIFIRMLCFSFITGLMSTGCTSAPRKSIGRPSPYDSYYKSESFIVPAVSAIEKSGQSRDYSKPFDEVYKATLEILSQYQGILAMNSSDSQHSMLVIKAREFKRAPEDKKRRVTYGGFFEQWLAVAIIKDPDLNTATVALASVNPGGELSGNEAAAQLFFSQIQIQLYSPNQWHQKFIVKNNQANYQTKAKSIESPTNELYEYHKLEQVLGGWIAKSMREELFTIYCPDVTVWLEGIVDKLKIAAGVPEIKTWVTVIPANGHNAFALPNGEIIVSSGLLDSLETTDQVASVLAHELDHLIQHDTISRLEAKQFGLTAAAGLRGVMGVASAVSGVAASVIGVGPLVRALWDLGQATLLQVSEQGANHLETVMVSNFSADAEASCRYQWI